MQNALNASSTASLKHFIPQSPATNIKRKEISRWQQRQNKNANQMTLLSNIETYFEKQESENVNLSNNTINNNIWYFIILFLVMYLLCIKTDKTPSNICHSH
eukprot:227209_1